MTTAPHTPQPPHTPHVPTPPYPRAEGAPAPGDVPVDALPAFHHPPLDARADRHGGPGRHRTADRVVAVAGAVLALGLVGAGTASALTQMLVRDEVVAAELPASVASLTVDSTAAEVEIRPIEAGETPSVTATWRGAGALDDVRIDPSASGAKVEGGCGGSVLTLWGEGRCRVLITASIPRDADVTVHTDTGRVDLRGLHGAVDVRTDAGEVRGVRLHGPVVASTDVGAIHLEESSSTDLDLSSSVGEVVVDAVVAPDRVRARTDVGSVELTVPDDGTAYRVLDRAGDLADASITVPRDEASTHVLELTSQLGGVTVRPAGH